MVKDNKFTIIVLVIFGIMFVMGAVFYSMVMPSNGKPAYGNRLDGIEKVELSSSDKNKITSSLEDEKIVKSSKVDIKGRIINVIIEVNEGTKEKAAKDLTDVVVKSLSEAQVGYYDIQVFITNESKDAEGFPMIGYKTNKVNKFTF